MMVPVLQKQIIDLPPASKSDFFCCFYGIKFWLLNAYQIRYPYQQNAYHDGTSIAKTNHRPPPCIKIWFFAVLAVCLSKRDGFLVYEHYKIHQAYSWGLKNVTKFAWPPCHAHTVLWIRNFLLRIRIRIHLSKVPDPVSDLTFFLKK
jgi:hypothetical protein